MEEVDWSSLHRILSDPTRRNILELLAEKNELSYTEIMSLLRITNTGRLNYHLKALNVLVSKDDQGRYSLTERGKLAANMVKTFPERVTAERKNLSTGKIALAVLLIVFGILLIFPSVLFALSAPLGGVSTASSTIYNRSIPQNTTVFLTSWAVQSNSELNFNWNASSPIYLYILNSTQYDFFLLQNSTIGQASTYVSNITGMPPSYLNQYHLQSGSVSVALSQGRYYFFAGSISYAKLDSLTLTQQHKVPENITTRDYLIAAVPGVIGILMVTIAVLIIKKRI